MVASRLRAPVVPIRLRGIDRVLPRYSKMIHPGRVEVTFGTPMELEGDDFIEPACKVEAAVRAL